MINAQKPASFHDSVLVARQVLDSGRDLAIVPLETFQEFCQSEFRDQLCQLLVNVRLTSYPVKDVLKAVPLLRAGIQVSELVATVVAPSGPLTVSPSAAPGPQDLLLTPEETKDLDTFTKVLDGVKTWDFKRVIPVMTEDRSMTPAVITDLTRIFKASFPFDKLFLGGFGGLNIFEISALTPIALATYMGLTVNGLTNQLNYGGEHQGLFFTGDHTPTDSPSFNSPIYLQPPSSLTPTNCAQFQIWTTAAAQGFLNGSYSLPPSCSLIYRKVAVVQELLYRFMVAFVKACMAANLGWAAGMPTTLETLRDNESVQ